MKKIVALFSMFLFAFILLNSAQASPVADTANEIILQPENKQYQVNTQKFAMSALPFNVDGRVFVPLDFLGSVLGNVDNPVNWRVSSGEETGGGPAGGINISSQEMKTSSPQMELDLQIPIITGLGEQALQEQINKEVREKALQTKAELEEESSDLAENAKTSGFPMRTFQFFMRYKSYTCGDIVSLMVESYQYSGGAHGGTTVDFYNLDTKNNKLLTLSDLFKDDVDYVSIINLEIIKQIDVQRKSDQIPYFQGEEGFQSIAAEHPFYIKDNELILHFGQYEIAPYAAGMPEFAIPLTFLKGHLRGLLGAPENIPAASGIVVAFSPEEHIKNDFYASIHYVPENDLLSFTIPETIPDGHKFYLHVSGRLLMGDSLNGMSFHAFDRESESYGWIKGETYTYPLKRGSLDECLLVFGLVDKEGRELLSTVHVYPDGTKRIKDRATIIFPAYAEENSGNLPYIDDINNSPKFTVKMELCEDWTIRDTRLIDEILIPGDFHTPLYIYEKEKPIGYLGFNKFEPYTDEIPQEEYYKTVYPRLRLSSFFHWDPYTAIKTTAVSETGVVNIGYLDPNEIGSHPGAKPDVPQFETMGILSYDKELKVFVGIAFMPDTVDYAQAETIARSISLSAIE